MSQRRIRGTLSQWRQNALRQMERSRNATLRLLASIPEDEILRPRTQGEWSIKDVLAHIVAWEEEAVKRLALIAKGKGERIVFYDDMRAADEFNARAVAAARSTSLSALVKRAARARQRLVDSLLQLPLNSLNDPSQRYPVIAWLPEFAWTHEGAHRRRIREWWRAQRNQARD